jgi:spore coat protein U-like protein
MKSGANVLNYNLYTTAAHTTVWGDGTAGTGTFSGGPY